MNIPRTDQQGHHIWTVTEAKNKLSEVLRLAKGEPQYIGMREQFVVLTKSELERLEASEPHMGTWLVENLKGLGPLEFPDRNEDESISSRKIPFQDLDDQ